MRRGAQGILLLLVAALWMGRECAAQPLQSPSLPTQPAGYIQYAITNAPSYYKNGLAAGANNTPGDNAITNPGATLGRVLFYDKRLSHSNGVSCASCHKQANGFSDPAQFSQGVNGVTGRHSMALANAMYYAGGKAFWDERAASLEAQALVPIENAVEMGSTLSGVISELNQTTFYPTLFTAAFGTPDITAERIGKAIGQFERSMVSYQSKFDQAFTNPSLLTPQESAGMTVFNSKGKCNQCHTSNAHFSDTTHNIGLDPAGLGDLGAGNGKFKSPSLRNVAVRGRFMHDGRFTTLAQVINFYNAQVIQNPDLATQLQTPLNLNPTERADLEAFLLTLTDNAFLTSSLFSDPFVNLPGDYNGDGAVDQGDYVVWRNSTGDTTQLLADGNNDLIVNELDYAVWRQNFGNTWLSLASGSGVGSALVPEPCGFVLMMIAFGAIANLRRRGV